MGKPLVDLFWIPFSSLPGEEIAFLDFRFPPPRPAPLSHRKQKQKFELRSGSVITL